MNIEEHVKSRHIDLQLHKVWFDVEDNVATFPLWNLSGQFVGYQRYRPDKDKVPSNNPYNGRYFTKVLDKKVSVWDWKAFRFQNIFS